jgi:ubiquinone/menaquinone biosynthesis C-methylase UbiE
MNELERIRNVYRQRNDAGVVGRYSPFARGELYMLQRREEAILRLLTQHGIADLKNLKILEVGCGRASRLLDWVRWGAMPGSLHGIDLMEEFIREGRLTAPSLRLAVGSAGALPYGDGSFDIVVQWTVFSSILSPSLKAAAAHEMSRVTSRTGVMIWYDFRYPSPTNANVRQIGKAELRELFPEWDIDLRSITLLPPVTRWLARRSFAACRLLEAAFPALRSHYVALLRRRSGSPVTKEGLRSCGT